MTVESAILNYFEWLRAELGNVKYGRVGLIFDMAGGCVTRIQKVCEISEKPGQLRIIFSSDIEAEKIERTG